MKKSILLIIVLISLSCSEKKESPKTEPSYNQTFTTDSYELYLSQNEQDPLLILFPDLGGNTQSTKESFNILSNAKKANISVLIMNFNHHLFLSKKDKNLLTKVLNDVVKSHNLSPDKVVIGGFSSGGIVSSLWSNHLLEINHAFKPQKTFAIDSPLDLVELFNNVTDVDSESHEVSKEEAEYITSYFEEALSTSDSLIQRISEVSPFIFSPLNFKNIERLNDIEFRLYTEPDSVWWKEKRGFEFKETDSYQLIRFTEIAKEHGWDNLQLIQTTNKGYRSNGQRHPHSWSIVDPKELVEWILKR